MFRRLAPLALTLLLGTAPAFANCGAEGCPLVARGPESAHGRFTFDLGFQAIEQNRLWDGNAQSHEAEGVGHVTEVLSRTRSWTGTASVELLPSLSLRATLPWLRRTHVHDLEHHAGFIVRSNWTYEGLGDATVLAHWRALGEPHAAAGQWSLLAGGKLPTGKRHIEVAEDEEEPEPPVRLGTGSTDAIAGLAVTRVFPVASPVAGTGLPLTVSVLGRWNGRGTDDYRVGDEWQANLGMAYALHPRVQALAQVNGIVHAKDEVGETDAEAAHSGGETVYVTPGLRVLVPGGVSAYAYWQARAYQHSNGPQLVAPSHLIVGFNTRIGN